MTTTEQAKQVASSLRDEGFIVSRLDTADTIDALVAENERITTALAERDAEIERLTSEAMFQQQMTEPDDIMFERIERAARASFRKHQSSIRGQQVTRADSYESHLVWAAEAEMNTKLAERDAEIEALKSIAESDDGAGGEGMRLFLQGRAQRKVLEQTLEAIEDFAGYRPDIDKAITAIQEVLHANKPE